MNIHPDSFLDATDLGKRFPPYRPNFAFRGEYIDEFHSLIGASAEGSGLINLKEILGIPIKGWLRKADALKLYELAYFCDGHILELGSFHGLSTCLLSQANHNSAARKHVYSVDLSPGNCAKTMETLQAVGLHRNVEILCSEAGQAVKRMAENRLRFGLVFVDHSHSYTPVYEVCKLLPMILNPDGFCLFHDFNDRRNEDPHHPDYGVYRAVIEGLDPNLCEFCGIYGCTGLYRARH